MCVWRRASTRASRSLYSGRRLELDEDEIMISTLGELSDLLRAYLTQSLLGCLNISVEAFCEFASRLADIEACNAGLNLCPVFHDGCGREVSKEKKMDG